jgi:hypothetical protein
MALERGDDLRPHLAAHMPAAEFFGDVVGRGRRRRAKIEQDVEVAKAALAALKL